MLEVVTYEGAPSGMITAFSKHEIPDGAAYYLQDILVDLPGLIRQRGPLTSVLGMVSFTNPVFGIVSCYDPAGSLQVGVLEGTSGSGYLSVLSSNYSAKTQLAWDNGFSTSPYPIVEARGKFTGGAFIGTSTQYDEGAATQRLAVWHGATKPVYSTGTMTCARNSTAVTGSGTVWTANASPGMYLFDTNGYFIGTVKSVNSDSSLTLMNSALQTVTGGAYSLKPVRGVNPIVTTGNITVANNATTVTGANTMFSQQGLGTGTWDIYRASDWTYVGTVSSVTNDTSLTLTGNGAINMSVERYFAVRRDGDWSTSTKSSSQKVGFISAIYANRQWFANRAATGQGSYLWFSDEIHPEAVNVAPNTGDFIPVSSGSAKSAATPIKSIMPGFNSLLIMKEDETFALVGQDETQFEVHKVWSDGALSGMSVQQWKDQVIFAGRNGIYTWDGTQVTDLTLATLGKEYRTAVKNFDPTTYRMWSSVVRDHYMLFIEQVTPDITVTEGSTPTTPSRWTVCINMNTLAVTLLTNVDIRGTLVLPVQQETATWFLVNTASGGAICDGNALFDNEGADNFTCAGNTVGPNFFLESKRYPLGDPLRRKLLKQIAMDYQAFGDGLTIDTLVGLGTVNAGSVSTNSFPSTSYTWDTLSAAYSTWDALATAFSTWDSINVDVWSKRRYKFLKHENYIGFRLYPNSSNLTYAVIGPWQFGFKLQAPGRI